MSTRLFASNNRTAQYVIAIVVIVLAFILLGGGTWVSGMTHGHRSISMGTANLIWSQILISLGIGFLIGYLVGRRR